MGFIAKLDWVRSNKCGRFWRLTSFDCIVASFDNCSRAISGFFAGKFTQSLTPYALNAGHLKVSSTNIPTKSFSSLATQQPGEQNYIGPVVIFVDDSEECLPSIVQLCSFLHVMMPFLEFLLEKSLNHFYFLLLMVLTRKFLFTN